MTELLHIANALEERATKLRKDSDKVISATTVIKLNARADILYDLSQCLFEASKRIAAQS